MPAILMIPKMYFPCHHAMLETVYTKHLAGGEYDVTWLMLSRDVARRTRTTWNGTIVYLFPTSTGRGFRAYLREVGSWFQLLAFCAVLVWRRRFDIIQVRNAVMAGAVAWILARLRGAKFVFQFSFPIPESLIQAAREGRTRIPWLQVWHGRLQMVVRTWLLRRADLVLAISDEMRRQVIRLGISAGRVMSFPLGADCASRVAPSLADTVRNHLHLNGQPVVLYFGVIDRTRRLDFLLRVAQMVKDYSSEVRWVILGGGDEAEVNHLRLLAAELAIEDVMHWVGRVPRADVSTYISLASVSVSPIPPGPLFDISSPTKTIESLACGCPVIATNIPDQAGIIRASGGGFVVPFCEQEYAEALIRMLRNPKEAKAMGAKGREYVRTHRSYEVLTESLASRYASLLARA